MTPQRVKIVHGGLGDFIALLDQRIQLLALLAARYGGVAVNVAHGTTDRGDPPMVRLEDRVLVRLKLSERLSSARWALGPLGGLIERVVVIVQLVEAFEVVGKLIALRDGHPWKEGANQRDIRYAYRRPGRSAREERIAGLQHCL